MTYSEIHEFNDQTVKKKISDIKKEIVFSMLPIKKIKLDWKLSKFDIVVSKVGDLSRGWPEGSLFNSYYTEV